MRTTRRRAGTCRPTHSAARDLLTERRMNANRHVALCAVLLNAASVVAEGPHSDTRAVQETQESLQKRALEGTVYDGLQQYPPTRCGDAGRSTREIEACWSKVLDIANAEQTRVRQVLVAFLDPTERKGFFQRDEAYQSALKGDCEERFPQGTIRGIAYASCIACGTRLRTRALEGLLDWTVLERGKQRQEERARRRPLQLPACEE